MNLNPSKYYILLELKSWTFTVTIKKKKVYQLDYHLIQSFNFERNETILWLIKTKRKGKHLSNERAFSFDTLECSRPWLFYKMIVFEMMWLLGYLYRMMIGLIIIKTTRDGAWKNFMARLLAYYVTYLYNNLPPNKIMPKWT